MQGIIKFRFFACEGGRLPDSSKRSIHGWSLKIYTLRNEELISNIINAKENIKNRDVKNE